MKYEMIPLYKFCLINEYWEHLAMSHVNDVEAVIW